MSQIEVRILQQEYVLTCPEGKEDALRAAVSRVDADMERIRSTGKIRARERVGVLAAINLAYENTELHSANVALSNALVHQQSVVNESEAELESASHDQSTPSDDTELMSNGTHAESIISDEVHSMITELESLLALREQELIEANALIQKLESALGSTNELV